MKKISLILALMLVLTGMVGCTQQNGGDSEPAELIISTWGFSEDLLWSNVFTPFEEEHNVKIILETGNNSDRLTKLKSNPDSGIDIIYLAEAFAQQGIDAGLFEVIDYSKIPNAEKSISNAQYLIEEGYGPAFTLNRASIAYIPSMVDFEVTSWSDLWDPSLEGKVTIPEITTTFGPSTMYIASSVGGVDITDDNGNTAFNQLELLKPNLVKTYSRSSDMANMFASGEVAMAIAADFSFGTIKAGSPDAVFVDPVEGTYLNFNTINIVKGTDDLDLALEFINYALSTEVQTLNAKTLNESPVNSEVELTEEEAADLTYGDKILNSNIVDHKFTNPLNAEWVEKWNRYLNQ